MQAQRDLRTCFPVIQAPTGTPNRYKELDGNDELLVFVAPQADDIHPTGMSLYDSTVFKLLNDGKEVTLRSSRGLGAMRVIVVGRCHGRPFEQRF